MAGDSYIAIEQFDQEKKAWVCLCILSDVWCRVWNHFDEIAAVKAPYPEPVFDWVKTCSPEVYKSINNTCMQTEPSCIWLGGGYRMVLYMEA